MSIQKKSLISTLQTAKKANAASAPMLEGSTKAVKAVMAKKAVKSVLAKKTLRAVKAFKKTTLRTA